MAQENYWGENIKFLRKRKQLSQEELAEQLGISRSKLNAHENGQSVNPGVEDLLAISTYFKVSVDALLRIELSKLSAFKLRELLLGSDVYISGSNVRVLAITVDKDQQENVEYIPIKAKAGYQAGYNDPEYIASFKKYSLPNLPKNGSYRMFPTRGDSMLPIPEGSDVVARYIEDWTTIKPQTLCILILRSDQDFVFKMATYMPEERELLLQSLNESYQPYRVPIDQVLELWQFHSFVSKDIPKGEVSMVYVNQKLDEISRELHQLRQQLG